MSMQIILGPMYSGKTSELLRRVRRYGHSQKKCVVIKYSKDTRYSSDECIMSHDRVGMQAIPNNGALLPLLANDLIKDAEVIGIDEGQFYSDIVEFAETVASNGKTVIIAALDGDFLRRPFGRILELVPLAEKVDKLTAVCSSCFGEAAFTHRTVASTDLELIGGAEAYVPHCRTCFETSTAKQKARQLSSSTVSPSSTPTVTVDTDKTTNDSLSSAPTTPAVNRKLSVLLQNNPGGGSPLPLSNGL